MYQSPQVPQPPLGVAYYGPPIPPQPYQRPRRKCCCCLLSTAIKIIIAVFVVFGITILILGLIYRVNKIKVTVQNASLTRFNLTINPTTTLSYNLTTQIAIRNPNDNIGIYYDWLESDAYYDGVRFSWVPLPTFYQGHENTTLVNALFQGQSLFVIDDSGVGDFRRDNVSQVFDLDLWVYARIRYKFGSLVTRRYVARVRCGIRVNLLTNGTRDNGFTSTECDVVDY